MSVLDDVDRTAPGDAQDHAAERCEHLPRARATSGPRAATADRAALARAVLARAEQRTGARSALRSATATSRGAVASASTAPASTVPASTTPSSTVPASTTPSSPGVATSAVPLPEGPVGSAGPAGPAGSARSALAHPDRPPLPVFPSLAPLLPDGALRRGTSLVMTGSTSLLLAMVAQASQEGSWVAAVGLPAVGLLAAQQAGVVLDRFALVPHPGPDAPTVLATLLDGVDLVVVGDDAALADSDRRRLTARARERGTVLLSTTSWPGAQVVLAAEPVEWTGLGAGHGHLRRHRLVVTRDGRGGAARAVRTEVVLPVRPETAVPATTGLPVTGLPATGLPMTALPMTALPTTVSGSRPDGVPAAPLRMVG